MTTSKQSISPHSSDLSLVSQEQAQHWLPALLCTPIQQRRVTSIRDRVRGQTRLQQHLGHTDTLGVVGGVSDEVEIEAGSHAREGSIKCRESDQKKQKRMSDVVCKIK